MLLEPQVSKTSGFVLSPKALTSGKAAHGLAPPIHQTSLGISEILPRLHQDPPTSHTNWKKGQVRRGTESCFTGDTI